MLKSRKFLSNKVEQSQQIKNVNCPFPERLRSCSCCAWQFPDDLSFPRHAVIGFCNQMKWISSERSLRNHERFIASSPRIALVCMADGEGGELLEVTAEKMSVSTEGVLSHSTCYMLLSDTPPELTHEQGEIFWWKEIVNQNCYNKSFRSNLNIK